MSSFRECSPGTTNCDRILVNRKTRTTCFAFHVANIGHSLNLLNLLDLLNWMFALPFRFRFCLISLFLKQLANRQLVVV